MADIDDAFDSIMGNNNKGKKLELFYHLEIENGVDYIYQDNKQKNIEIDIKKEFIKIKIPSNKCSYSLMGDEGMMLTGKYENNQNNNIIFIDVTSFKDTHLFFLGNDNCFYGFIDLTKYREQEVVAYNDDNENTNNFNNNTN